MLAAVGYRPEDREPTPFIDTTVGRVLFNLHLPAQLQFVNEMMDKRRLQDLVGECYQRLGMDATARLVDEIKDTGFRYATKSGISIAVSDITVPPEKELIIQQTSDEVSQVEHQYRRGLITEDEQYMRTVELWTKATDDITQAVARHMDPDGPIRVMAVSGATKGSFTPIRQLAGMRGLMADPAGRIIALPIRSNFREGLTALEYFISTHGARKGLADTALRTADAGYLTRRLVDVAQDVIIDSETVGPARNLDPSRRHQGDGPDDGGTRTGTGSAAQWSTPRRARSSSPPERSSTKSKRSRSNSSNWRGARTLAIDLCSAPWHV
jgi:DNA-directed RNA polymerase subunit beta'